MPDSVRLAYTHHVCIGNPVEGIVYKMAAKAEGRS